jgi:hypothetical protein
MEDIRSHILEDSLQLLTFGSGLMGFDAVSLVTRRFKYTTIRQTWGTTHPAPPRHIPEELNRRQQHRYENVKCRISTCIIGNYHLAAVCEAGVLDMFFAACLMGVWVLVQVGNEIFVSLWE